VSKKIKHDEKPLKKIRCACTSLKMASRVVSRGYDLAIESSGLNVTQYSILTNISRYQPISQMRLSEHLDMERTTLYRSLDILEDKGWVKVQPTGEGLTKVVELTAKGKELTAAAGVKWKVVHDKFVAKFGSEKWDELAEMLDEVRDYFKASL
jgi:DNA-binding MarR family transcriptional regulator